MSIFDYNDPIITKRRKGTFDDSYVFKSESHQIENSYVVLSEIPNELEKVVVSGEGISWYEQKNGLPTENTYVVNYVEGIINFHKSRNGLQLQFEFYGTGLHYIPSSRVYTRTDESGNVVETLGSIIESGRNAIDVINTLDEKIEEVNNATSNAIAITNTASEKIQLMDNAIVEEQTRMSNEDGRVIAENQRILDENTRIANENERQTQEINRINAYNTINTVLPNVINLENLQSWNTATQYHKNNIVEYNGSSFMALVDNLNKVPPTLPIKQNAYWQLLAQRGIDGNGSVSSVNGISPDVNGDVVLDATGLGVIPSSEKGIANGVATLNADGKVVDALGNEIEVKVASVNGQIGDVVIQDSSTTQKGIVQLNDTLLSTSITEALTANQGKVLDDKINDLSQDVNNHVADYEYQSPTVVGTQIQLTKQSNTSIIKFKLTTSLSGNITISLDSGVTEKPLNDFDGVQLTSLDKGFVEVIEESTFFTLRSRGGGSNIPTETMTNFNNAINGILGS